MDGPVPGPWRSKIQRPSSYCKVWIGARAPRNIGGAGNLRVLARPGVVWFGEPLPDGMMKEAEHAAAAAEVFLVIGTSKALSFHLGFMGAVIMGVMTATCGGLVRDILSKPIDLEHLFKILDGIA